MESIWNANIPWNPHGIHVESMWNMFGSIWNIELSPYGMEIFHRFHTEWTCVHSIWIPGGFQVDSIWIRGLSRFWELKKMHSFILQTQLITEMVGGQRCDIY